VLVHGLGLDHRMWERQAPALAAAGHRVIACDLPGHGAADRPARAGSAYSTAELAASLVGVLDEAGVARGVLVGFSLGGGVALQVALAPPSRVPGLALVDTTAWPGPDALARFGGRAALVEAEGVGVLVQPAIERWFTPSFVATHPEIVGRYAAWIRDNDAIGYAAACRSLATLDLRSRLGEIRCPTLVVVGDRDQATPVAMAETLAAGIAGATLRVLGPAGHLVTEERWAELNAALLGFLAGHG
jgi:3-oxoadipate enol-lactonase